LDLIRGGQFKRAVEAAKDLHRQSPSQDSELVLAEAYIARIFSFEPHMAVEAEALFRLAAERCPSARARIEAIRPRLGVRFGRLEEAVRPLASEEAAEEARAAAEDALRRELTDVAALATCPALPDAHPLRRAAAEIDAAFRAVTSAPAREEDLSLPHVSRRSPLAAWKPLIRSIAAFYRDDAAACQAHLALVDAESAPAHAVPALRALLAGATADGSLVEKVGGGAGALRAELSRLDDAFARGKPPEILHAIADAVSECRRRRPDLVVRLRQRISIRCMMAELPVTRVRSAMGGPALRDAGFFRLFALACEKKHDPVAAALAWSSFRDHSVREGAFAENGPETAAVRLRILDLIENLPHDELAAHASRAESGADASGPCTTAREALDAGLLFERVAAADPRPEVFERWLAWARRNGGERAAKEVALAWKRASAGDARPLILLMEMAERRGAFKKALGLLGEAESLDRLSPFVAQARFRLMAAMALRHLEQLQARLAARDLAGIEALPEARLGRRPAFVAALRHLVSRQMQDSHRQTRAEVVSILGGEREAFFLLAALEGAVRQGPAEGSALPGGSPLELVTALASVAVLCNDVGVPIALPAPWEKKLVSGLAGDRVGLPDDAGLRAVAECALRSNIPRLAYVASGAGLRRGTSLGRFLLLRAHSLSWAPRRRRECLAAATALAVRARDSPLIAEIRDRMPWYEGQAAGDGGLEREEIERIVAREAAAEYRSPDISAPPGAAAPHCAVCGRAHEAPVAEDDLAGDDDSLEEDEDDDLDDEELAEVTLEEILRNARSLPRGRGRAPRLPAELAGLPPKLLALFLEMLSRFGDIPDPEEIATSDPALYARFSRAIDEQLMKGGALPGMGRHGRRPKRRRRR
jgi:hypothetical protein